MRIRENWICICGLKQNVSDKCSRGEKEYRSCKFCKSLPSEEDKIRIIKEKITKKLKIYLI